MSESVQKPRIRFKGFSDAWEQRKVSEMFKVTRGYVLASTLTEAVKTDKKPYPVYSSQTKDNGLMGYYKDYLYEDAITWTTDGANAGTVNYRAGKFYCTNVCGVLLSNEVTANQMIAEALNNVAKGYVSYVGNPKLMNNVMADIEIMIPTQSEEREKLSVLFRNLDNLITLHQRKYDKLVAVKKALLEKMFPADGETVPKIRFKGFSDAWEQRKAKELCSISTGKSNTQDQVDDGKYPFYIRSDIPVRSNKYLYDCEAVITIGDGNIGKVFHYVNGKFDLHQRCYKMTDFQDIWGKYFFYYFSTKFYDRAMKMTAKATVDSVRLEMISEMDIKQPFQISEQKQIAEFFDYLNNLITLHQCKDFSLKSVFEESKNFISALRKNTSWEQRKLGELALFNPKDALPQTFEYVDLESVVGTEMLSHRTEVKSSAPSRAQRLAHTGDLFYQTVRPYQKNNYLFEKPDNNYVFSTGYAQMRPYVDGYFLLSLVQSEHFVKVVLDNCTGTSYPAINANDLAEIEVTAPSDESEAQKIGTIFRNIDNLITLHQRIKIFFTGDYHDQKNK